MTPIPTYLETIYIIIIPSQLPHHPSLRALHSSNNGNNKLIMAPTKDT
jgi:hypothetical protein